MIARIIPSLIVLALLACGAPPKEADAIRVQPVVAPATSPGAATTARKDRIPSGFREARGEGYTLHIPASWVEAEPIGHARTAYLGPAGADGFAQRVELDRAPYDGTTSEWAVGAGRSCAACASTHRRTTPCANGSSTASRRSEPASALAAPA